MTTNAPVFRGHNQQELSTMAARYYTVSAFLAQHDRYANGNERARIARLATKLGHEAGEPPVEKTHRMRHVRAAVAQVLGQ